jgi:hypothetical protein
MSKDYQDLIKPYDPYPVKPPQMTRDGVLFESGMRLWYLDCDYDSPVYELESIETFGMTLVLEPDAHSHRSYWFLVDPRDDRRNMGYGLHIEELYAVKQNAIDAGLEYYERQYEDLTEQFLESCEKFEETE